MKFLKNLSIRGKIFGTFAVVLTVAVTIGILGIFSANRLGSEISDMYHQDTEPIGSISHVIQNVMTLSSSFDMAILAAMSDDYRSVKEYEDSVNALYIETDLLLQEVEEKIFRDEVRALFDSATQKYYDSLVPTGPAMFGKLNAGHIDEAEDIMEAADVAIGEMTEEFKNCLDKKIEKAYDTFLINEASVRGLNTLLTIILIIGFLVTCGLAIVLSASITKPMLAVMRFAKETADTGNLELSTHEIDRVAERRDEIGVTVQAFCEMTGMFREQAGVLHTVSNGDLTPDVALKSQEDTVGSSLSNMLEEIGGILRDVAAASKQVAMGIDQISTGSNDLSNSINEQNRSIENISSTLHSISEQVDQNLASANSAKDLAYRINEEAKSGDKNMTEMVLAVHKINEASGGIGKIIKTIDDIAFQTNILALNAAVEAARAGQHGKGFAVVADEVRNLAAKSAEAAAESNALISNSLQLTESGVEIAETTRKSIETITSGIHDISAFIEQMSLAASNQALAMEQLSGGIHEISGVVQRTSANAEQSSAACEEISALSASLDGMVSKFKIKSE